MQRRSLLKSLVALTLAERLDFLHGAWAAGNKLAAPGFYKIRGQVSINGQPAREGMLVNAGDTIVTGPGSEAIYVIGQDAYLQRDNSAVAVAGDILKSGLRVLNGKLLSVFGKGNKRIETATATIGIRGTGCYLEASAEKTYFCLCYGLADIALARDSQSVRTVQTTHHEQPLYLHADPRLGVAMAPMVNHSDTELVMLENLVGRLPPFVGLPSYGSYR